MSEVYPELDERAGQANKPLPAAARGERSQRSAFRTIHSEGESMLYIVLWSIFLTALLVTFVTDYYYLLIHRAATLFLIPLFLLGAFLLATPCSLLEALLGFFVGYGFLWCFKTFYLWHRNIDGIGQGDLELLSMIGSFLGPMGVLYTITFGSIIGTIIALIMLFTKRTHAQTQLPFGSFLVIGCFMHLLIMLKYCHILPY